MVPAVVAVAFFSSPKKAAGAVSAAMSCLLGMGAFLMAANLAEGEKRIAEGEFLKILESSPDEPIG